jgi:membrane protease YdiL (CAAX protease family)
VTVESTDSTASVPVAPLQLSLTLQILVVLCLGVLPDFINAILACQNAVDAYGFYSEQTALFFRSLQVGVVLLAFIHLTGAEWRRHGLSYGLSWSDWWFASGLFVASYGCWWGLIAAADLLSWDLYADAPAVASAARPVQLPALVLCTLIVVDFANAFAEELTMRGWLIPKLEELFGSRLAAVSVSSWLWAAYHLYQGSFALLVLVTTGLLYGFWFARTSRLWPLVICHALLNITGRYWYW